MSEVRTRFAPSPTGHVHIGNVRVAIFNWLYARGRNGKFLLRVEDTDRERSTPEAVEALHQALAWLELSPDEEPTYQSTRQDAHLAAAERLVAEGKAYREDKGGTGQGEATIFRMPGTDMGFEDEVRGALRKPADSMQDFVIVRSNGKPVFHLANVLDDIDMGVTHVIRGDDHIENTYRHVALYQALGAPVPRFAHLPMIVNDQGKPYSKRDGDAWVGDFRDKGFLPQALFNYLALLGWSPGDDREVMAREDMVEAFSFTGVQSSAARMDMAKLLWMNGEYIRALPPEELQARCRAVLDGRGLLSEAVTDAYLARVVGLMQERVKLLPDFADQAGFFFTEDFAFDQKAVRKRLLKAGALDGLRALRARLADLDTFDGASTEAALRRLAEEREVSAGQLVHPVRVATSGLAGGPSLFEMLEVLGKTRVLDRIDRALARFGEGAPS
jgi:glutamyl-tRNA synthetase